MAHSKCPGLCMTYCWPLIRHCSVFNHSIILGSFALVAFDTEISHSLPGWRIPLLDHASLHTHTHTLTYALSLVLVVMMRSKELKTSRTILVLIL